MNLEIKKIRIKELEEFINSKLFAELEFIPISVERAVSYLKNPNAQHDDVALYLGFINKRLVAFRSLFADVARNGNTSIRFGWCSGSWVHPAYRRRGFSIQLLKEAYSDWGQKLMLTNYAPNAEKLILKTGLFQPVHKYNGVRAYLYPKTRKLIHLSNKNLINHFVFSAIDFIIIVISFIRTLFFKGVKHAGIEFQTFTFPDNECYQHLNTNKNSFNRNQQNLKWIFSYPWISGEKSEYEKRYPFSSCSKSFYYKTVKVFEENRFIGFFIFSVREGHLKTLYFQIPDGFEDEIIYFLKKYCRNHKIEMATIYKSSLTAKLFNRKFPFLYIKNYGQKIYSTFEIAGAENLVFQDGDGDVIFT